MSRRITKDTLKSLKNEALIRKMVEEVTKELNEPDYTKDEGCTVTDIIPMFKPDPNPDNSKALIPEKTDKKKSDKKKSDKKKSRHPKPTEDKACKIKKHQEGDVIGADGKIKVAKDKVAPIVGATLQKAPEKLRKPKEEKLQVVTFELKGKKGHPVENRIEGNFCFYVNGKAGQTLKLQKSKKYQFRFLGREGSGYEIILTTDSVGGRGSRILDKTSSLPIGKSCVVELINCPNIFYYQDHNKQYLGGIVQIE